MTPGCMPSPSHHRSRGRPRRGQRAWETEGARLEQAARLLKSYMAKAARYPEFQEDNANASAWLERMKR